MANYTKRIKSYNQEIKRFWGKVKKSVNDKDCWIWQGGTNTDGYGDFYTNNKHIFSHRFSWESTFGIIKEKDLRVLHKCDNPPCVNPDHLFLGTQQENIKDMISKGRMYDRSGTRNPKAKLNEKDIHEIRKMRLMGMKYKQIAIEKNVSVGCVNHILNNRHWGWME